MTTPIGGGFTSINVTLRKKFELYVNFRPIRNLPGLETRYPDVDLIIVRENTEGEYVGLEHEVVPGVMTSLKVITEKGSTRIAKWAFEYARKHRRRKIHAIHKANIMKLSDGMFLKCAREIAKGFPEITYGEHIIDNTCMQLVTNPYQYDTLLLTNLYGDIVSDLCAAFVGGLGLVPGRISARMRRFSRLSMDLPRTSQARILQTRRRCCSRRYLCSTILMKRMRPIRSRRPWSASIPRRRRSLATCMERPAHRPSRMR